MTKRYEIRLAGTGGQGLLLAGLFLAEAAAIHDGKHVVQAQSYAPFARGGASSSEIIIGEEEIDYPRVTKPHLVVVLSQPAYDSYAPHVRRDGIVVVDSSTVEAFEAGDDHHHRTLAVPITDIAVKATGRALTASIVSLGIIAELSGMVSREALQKAIASRSPRGSGEVNRAALEVGLAAGARLKEGIAG